MARVAAEDRAEVGTDDLRGVFAVVAQQLGKNPQDAEHCTRIFQDMGVPLRFARELVSAAILSPEGSGSSGGRQEEDTEEPPDIKGLQVIDDRQLALRREYRDQVNGLRTKYARRHERLLEEKKEICTTGPSGSSTRGTTHASSGLTGIDEWPAELQQGYKGEVNDLMKQYVRKQVPLIEERKRILTTDPAGISGQGGTPSRRGFWLKALQHHPALKEYIQTWDEPVLRHLIDVRTSNLDEDPSRGFRLVFTFSENPYFTDTEVWKEYHTKEADRYGGDLTTQKILVSEIDWKAGKGIPCRKFARRGEAEESRQEIKACWSWFLIYDLFRSMQRHRKSEEKPRPSFFRDFIRHMERSVDLTEYALEALMDKDYQAGCALRDEIIPFAFRWFTGDGQQKHHGNYWRNIYYGTEGNQTLAVYEEPVELDSKKTARGLAFGERVFVSDIRRREEGTTWLLVEGLSAGGWVVGETIDQINCVPMGGCQLGRIPGGRYYGQRFPHTGMHTEGYPGAQPMCLVSACCDNFWRELNVELLFRDIGTSTVFGKSWGGAENFLDWVAVYSFNCAIYGHIGDKCPKALKVTVKPTADYTEYPKWGPHLADVKGDLGNAQYKECCWLHSNISKKGVKWESVEFLTTFQFLKVYCHWEQKDCKELAEAKAHRVLVDEFKTLDPWQMDHQLKAVEGSLFEAFAVEKRRRDDLPDEMVTLLRRSASIIKKLKELLKTLEGNTSKQKDSFVAFTKMGTTAQGTLSGLLRDREPHMRREAATALGKIGGPEALEPLKDALKDRESRVRYAAATALGIIGRPEALDPLKEALKYPDFDVRCAAEMAIDNIQAAQVAIARGNLHTIKVSGCGMADFNGRYVPDGDKHGRTKYRKAGGGVQTFTYTAEYGSNFSTILAHWSLCYNHAGEWYKAESEDALPPRSGWQPSDSGRGPSPSVSCHSMNSRADEATVAAVPAHVKKRAGRGHLMCMWRRR